MVVLPTVYTYGIRTRGFPYSPDKSNYGQLTHLTYENNDF